MKISTTRSALVATASVLTVALALGTSQASAQNLFELLFGGNNRGPVYAEPHYRQTQPQPQPQPAPQPQRTQPVSVPRVAGPQYYDYRADALVRVDFAAIAIEDDTAFHRTEGVQLASAGGIDIDVVTATTLQQTSDERPAVATPRVADPAPAADQRRNTARGGGFGTPDPAFARDVEAAVEATRALEPEPASGPRLTADLLQGLAEFELYAEKAAAEAIVAHYAANPNFIWVSADGANAAAEQALVVLADAGSHALDPSHYAVRQPRRGASAEELARFEMELSARVLRYVRDVHGGRIDPNRISGYHDLEVRDIDYAGELAALASAGEGVAAHLATRPPQNRFYEALRAELATLRTTGENEIVVRPDTFVRPGQTNAEFPKILEIIRRDADAAFLAEHGEMLDRHAGSERYVEELVPVVRAAQAAKGLQVDGIIGPQTVRGLAGESVAGRIEKVEIALEQARWLPEFASRYVFLNAPSYRATYFENGREALSMRAIYGKSETQTFFFKDRVSYVEFHPYWGMPRSILINTYLSRVLQDPSYFDRSGYEVTDRNGRRVSSASVDWGAYGANIPFDVRQLPGPRNALGELKIMFPNRHAIYMHDTPDRHLFDRANRAISNGCVRLEDPRAMAAAVLGWSREQVASRLAGQHGRQNLDVEVPVYVVYFTAWPDEAGEVQFYDDVYGRDRRVADALAKIERLRAPSG